MVSLTPNAPHDELVCSLWRDEQGPCLAAAVVSVIEPGGEAVWGCKLHATQALDAVDDARINQVSRLGGRSTFAVAALEPLGEDRLGLRSTPPASLPERRIRGIILQM